jgi:hypothetical protein
MLILHLTYNPPSKIILAAYVYSTRSARKSIFFLLQFRKKVKRKRTPIKILSLASRVTRLGEFSPDGRLFTLAILLKITEVAQILGLLFATVIVTD